MFSNTHQMTVGWGDCDPAGIVFYPRFFAMFDAATAFLLEAATGQTRAELVRHYQIVGWPMVNTGSVFHAPVSYDDKILIIGKITGIGRSSFKVRHRLFRDALLCVTCTEVRVWARAGHDGKPITSAPLPDEVRARLSSIRDGDKL